MPWVQEWGFSGSQVLQAHTCITQERFTAPWSFCPASPSSPNPFSKCVWEQICPQVIPTTIQAFHIPGREICLSWFLFSLLSVVSNSYHISGKHFKTPPRTTLDQHWYLASSRMKLSTLTAWMHQLQGYSWALQTQSTRSHQLEPAPGTHKEPQSVTSSQESVMVLPAWGHQHLQNQHLWGLLGHIPRDPQDSWCYWEHHLVFILTSHLLQNLRSMFALLPFACLIQILLLTAAQHFISALSLQFCFPPHCHSFPSSLTFKVPCVCLPYLLQKAGKKPLATKHHINIKKCHLTGIVT